jgi:hypothetical protein
MKKLDIAITKAQLTGFGVRFDEDGEMRVEATISLMTELNKEITTFTISTHSWQDENKFLLPIEMVMPVQKIAAALEHVVIEHIREGQLKLAGGDGLDEFLP